MSNYEIINTPSQEELIYKTNGFANLCILISILSLVGLFSIYLTPISIVSIILNIILKYKIKNLSKKSIFYNNNVVKVKQKSKISLTITITIIILFVLLKIL